ncbi:hypothetical protein BDR03DRAFT_590684 [Suillus americanus]|nr:hypothetical protein BDR03DRAFT_590684 [Suillus americanus]
MLSYMYVIDAAALLKTYFDCLRELGEGRGTMLTGQRTELEHDSAKADAFIGCVDWKFVVSWDHIIDPMVYADATKAGALCTEEEQLIAQLRGFVNVGGGRLVAQACRSARSMLKGDDKMIMCDRGGPRRREKEPCLEAGPR